MPKSPLVVRVEEPETGSTWDYVFEAGPVTVGRGDDVHLQIARPYVSIHHGTFDFDDNGVTYVDLESRNSTLIDGARAGDRPVPVTEASDIRIGKVRLTVSRTLPAVGEDKPNPFAARPGAKAPAKGTDALPREDVERIRQEILAQKAAPPAPVVVAPRAPEFPPLPPLAPPPPSAVPVLEKTAPVPLPARPLTPVPRPTPPSPYEVGGTAALPLPPRETRPRRTTGSRPVSAAPVRRPSVRAVVQRPVWLYVALALVFVAGLVATALVVALGGETEEEMPTRRPRLESGETIGGPAPRREPEVVRRPVVEEPIRQPIKEKAPEPAKPVEAEPQPTVEPPTEPPVKRAERPQVPPRVERSNRSPILP